MAFFLLASTGTQGYFISSHHLPGPQRPLSSLQIAQEDVGFYGERPASQIADFTDYMAFITVISIDCNIKYLISIFK